MDEALRFAVGPRGVGSRAEMAQSEGLAHGGEPAGHIPAAVVAHHATDRDLAAGEPRHTALEKGGTRVAALVRQHFDEGDPTVIVDRDMHILPAGAAHGPSAVAMDAVPDRTDLGQRLDIHVQQVARPGPLIPLDRDGRPGWWAADAEPSQPRTHRRAGPAQGASNGPGGQALRHAELPHLRHDARRRLVGGRAGPRRRVLQRGRTADAKAAHPLRHRARTHGKGRRRLGIGPVLVEHAMHQRGACGRGRLGVTMNPHPGPPLSGTVVSQLHSVQSAPDEQRT